MRQCVLEETRKEYDDGDDDDVDDDNDDDQRQQYHNFVLKTSCFQLCNTDIFQNQTGYANYDYWPLHMELCNEITDKTSLKWI